MKTLMSRKISKILLVWNVLLSYLHLKELRTNGKVFSEKKTRYFSYVDDRILKYFSRQKGWISTRRNISLDFVWIVTIRINQFYFTAHNSKEIEWKSSLICEQENLIIFNLLDCTVFYSAVSLVIYPLSTSSNIACPLETKANNTSVANLIQI
jgi:hypothetical protein